MRRDQVILKPAIDCSLNTTRKPQEGAERLAVIEVKAYERCSRWSHQASTKLYTGLTTRLFCLNLAYFENKFQFMKWLWLAHLICDVLVWQDKIIRTAVQVTTTMPRLRNPSSSFTPVTADVVGRCRQIKSLIVGMSVTIVRAGISPTAKMAADNSGTGLSCPIFMLLLASYI
jgi:hypothetical protein